MYWLLLLLLLLIRLASHRLRSLRGRHCLRRNLPLLLVRQSLVVYLLALLLLPLVWLLWLLLLLLIWLLLLSPKRRILLLLCVRLLLLPRQLLLLLLRIWLRLLLLLLLLLLIRLDSHRLRSLRGRHCLRRDLPLQPSLFVRRCLLLLLLLSPKRILLLLPRRVRLRSACRRGLSLCGLKQLPRRWTPNGPRAVGRDRSRASPLWPHTRLHLRP